MGLETFPEIENFQKLPRQVIVKAGNASFSEREGAELRGIVINNIGHTICALRVHVVLLDTHGIPIMSAVTTPEPDALPQGGIASFVFRLKEYTQQISNFHLYTNWRFDDRE